MVIDTFTYFNEEALLELRLETLDPYVDHFVLVEGTRTHSNKPKELLFKRNQQKFEKFKHKIVHIVVDDWPADRRPWSMEHFQRDAIHRGLYQLKLDREDIILFSDVDEIPDPKCFRYLKSLEYYKSIIFKQKFFYYFFNNEFIEGAHVKHFKLEWMFTNTRAMQWKIAKQYPSDFCRRMTDGLVIANAGWHFSYLNTIDNILQKMDAAAHQEFNTEENRKRIEESVRTCTDPFGRLFEYQKVELDDTFPPYLLENKERFSQFILQ